MTFKDQIQEDIGKVFFNPDEFSELHSVNGKKIPCMIDNMEHIDRQKRYMYNRSLYADGVYLKEVLIYVKAEDYGPLPRNGALLTMDGKGYKVTDTIEENGIYSISLERNQS